MHERKENRAGVAGGNHVWEKDLAGSRAREKENSAGLDVHSRWVLGRGCKPATWGLMELAEVVFFGPVLGLNLGSKLHGP